MSTDRETVNPFEAPQTTAEPAKPAPTLEEKRLASKEQAIGFGLIAGIALAVWGVGTLVQAVSPQVVDISKQTSLDTLKNVFIGFCILGAPTSTVCGAWAIFCLGRWWLLSDQIRRRDRAAKRVE